MRDRVEKGIISQTRALYKQLSGETRRLAQRDVEAARRRGPVAKVLLAACILAVLAAVVTLVYGFISFSRWTDSGNHRRICR
jgi:type VI protein secretion system component VasF